MYEQSWTIHFFALGIVTDLNVGYTRDTYHKINDPSHIITEVCVPIKLRKLCNREVLTPAAGRSIY